MNAKPLADYYRERPLSSSSSPVPSCPHFHSPGDCLQEANLDDRCAQVQRSLRLNVGRDAPTNVSLFCGWGRKWQATSSRPRLHHLSRCGTTPQRFPLRPYKRFASPRKPSRRAWAALSGLLQHVTAFHSTPCIDPTSRVNAR